MTVRMIALSLFGLIVSSQAHAVSALKCVDQDGQVIFKGLVQPTSPMPSGTIKQGFKVTYTMSISSQPAAVVDRPSMQREFGITAPNCRGPYLKVYEKQEKTKTLACKSGVMTELPTFKGTDAETFSAFNLTSEVSACSIVLSSDIVLRINSK